MIDTVLTWVGQLLKFFDQLTGSYMASMLIFALIMEILFLPFGIKQQKNTIKQAKLRPKEMAIRNKYKGRNDQATQQKMQQEITEFYQKENFNPMGGCLPLLLQLPIILALYQIIINPLKYVVGLKNDQITAVLTRLGELGVENAESLRKNTIEVITHIRNFGVEAFSDIAGFSDKVASLDDLPNFTTFGLNLGETPSRLGWSILLIVPVLVFAAQYLSTLLIRKFSYQAPSAQDVNMGCSNKVMEITFPLMSAYFAYVWPAAVGVYWIAKSVLSVFKQMLMSKIYPIPVFTEEDYKAAEKEMNAKNPKRAPRAAGGNGKKVRSLHHIDDEDFEDTRTKVTDAPAPEPKPDEDTEPAPSDRKTGLADAPLKDETRDDTK